MERLILGLLIAASFGYSIFNLWKCLNMFSTKTIPIGQLCREGKVEINGTVKAKLGQYAQGTNRKTVYHKEIFEIYRRGTKSSGWRREDVYEDRVEFYVEDNSGQILINPNRASIDVACKEITGHTDSVWFIPIGARRSRRFYLEEGASVYVIGYLFSLEKTIGEKPGIAFIISDKSELMLLLKYGLIALLSFALAIWLCFSLI